MDYWERNELEGHTLKQGDKVHFLVNKNGSPNRMTYDVMNNHLSCGGANSRIFQLLGITYKYDFCSDVYGYKANKGDWPESADRDYVSLTRLVLKLFELCEEKRNGGKKMKLENIKKSNLATAKKKFQEEKLNEEVEYAKRELRRATDEIDRLDRDIQSLEEQKKPYLEILKKFS